MQTIDNLPDELLGNILTILFSAATLYTRSTCSVSCPTFYRIVRCKKSVVLVCRRWKHVGTPFLYREVTIRRPGALLSLLHTLIETENASLIREFEIPQSCYVDWYDQDNSRVFCKNIGSLLRLCPQLTAFNLQPLCATLIPDIKMTFSKANLPNLTSLELGLSFNPDIDSDRVHVVTELGSQLRCLSIHLTGDPEIQPEFASPLEFPHLTSLRFIFHLPTNLYMGFEADADVDEWVPQLPFIWALPCLENLSFRFLPETHPYEECVGPFLEQYGSRLRSLGFNRSRKGYGSEYILPYLKHCLELQHLSLDRLPTSHNEVSEEISIPSLTTLDVFTHPNNTTVDSEWRTDSDWSTVRSSPEFDTVIAKVFPNLRFLRFFSQFNVENIFCPPLYLPNYNPIHILEEAFSWLRPDSTLPEQMDVKPFDHITFEKLAIGQGYEERRYVYITVIHPPSPYHPTADEWGNKQDPLFILGSPTPSEHDNSSISMCDAEDIEEDDAYDSYSETSYDSEDWASGDDEILETSTSTSSD